MTEQALKYFELYDDMSTDQRWYLDDPSGPDSEWLGGALYSGRRYDGAVPLTCRVHHSGPPLELTMTLMSVPVINERVAEIFAAHVGRDAQLILARASESDEKLWAINVLARPDCFDEVRTEEFERWTAEDGRPDRIGHYRSVFGLRIDPARAGGHAILRPHRYWQPVIVSEPLAEALRKANVRCELTLVS
jgi:hypothetical protein